MPPDLTRRTGLLAAPALLLTGAAKPAPFEALERLSGGRLGVYARGPGLLMTHRADERFPMCSTFKALLAACVLARADAGREDLKRAILIPVSAVLSHAPVAGPAAKTGEPLTVQALCAAVVSVSDNTAANALLARVGGPAAFTAWLRGFDPVTRLDRTEPALNEALPGDLRDTTTPAAMAASLEAVLFGAVLKPASRALLLRWMTEATTGLNKLRAGLPAGWGAADKTGSNGADTAGDNAVLTAPGGGRILVSAYVTQSTLRGAEQEAIFADIARIIVAAYRG
jgi:beta-lactamase class A